MRIVIGVAIALSFASSETLAYEVATKSAIARLQIVEQIVSLSDTIQEYPQLKRQSDLIADILKLIPDAEDAGIRASCTAAANSLQNLAANLAETRMTDRARAAAREQQIYLQTMPTCERALGLRPLAKPNLR